MAARKGKPKIKVMHNGSEQTLVFRENRKTGQVEARVDKVVVLCSSEYKTLAENAQRLFGLTDTQLIDLYRDYKDDYDK